MLISTSLVVMNFKLETRLLSGLLRHFSTRHGLATADLRQRFAERLRGEDSHTLLLHGSHILLGGGRLRLFCISFMHHLVNFSRRGDTRFRS